MITPADFDALMSPLGPFEPAPVLAVAVSGGADSMALALLAAEWARARGGEAVALTVDHGLRPDSATEAAQVTQWLRTRGIRHHILNWDGDKPAADIQAAARAARYGLLEGWCRAHGVLHLLLAHHRDDQAETLLLRLERGSGLDGLAAMAPVQDTAFLRLLRPLLPVDPARLRLALREVGQDWIEDPSNRNPAFARVRLRQTLDPVRSARLAAAARNLGRARAALEQAVAEAAARFVRVEPGGWAVADPAAFATLPEETGLRLMSRLLLAFGGNSYTPRLERIEALYAALRAGLNGARTLAGCRVAPTRGGVLVCREAARMEGPVNLVPGTGVTWDGRWRIRVPADLPAGFRLGALGAQGWNRLDGRLPAVPALVRPTLVALYSEDAISAVPAVGYNRKPELQDALQWIVAAPANPLTVAGRCLV